MTDRACEKCGGATFQLREHAPAGSEHKVTFVQCAKCGTPIGILAFNDVEGLLQHQEGTILAISKMVADIDGGIRRIVQALTESK
jgi:hypothetical protein